jgi:hypothetical protein
MAAQLEVCAMIATEVPIFRIQVPEELGAARLAAKVARHSLSLNPLG